MTKQRELMVKLWNPIEMNTIPNKSIQFSKELLQNLWRQLFSPIYDTVNSDLISAINGEIIEELNE